MDEMPVVRTVATGVHSEAALREAGAIRVYAGPAALLEHLDGVLRGAAGD